MSDDELRDGAWRSWLLVIECLTWGVFPVGVPLPGRSRPLGEPGEGMGRRSSAGCAGARRQRLSRLGRFPLVLRAARRELGTCHAYKTPDLGSLTVEGFSWREGPAHPARANPEGGTIDVHQQHALARGARSRPNRYRARRESSPARLWLPLRLWRPARPGVSRGRRVRDQRDDGRRGSWRRCPAMGRPPHIHICQAGRALLTSA
jgi:hypothetical protein